MSHEPSIPASWRRRIERLAGSVDDVASAQHDLQAQIDQLVTMVAGLRQAEHDTVSDGSTPAAAPSLGPPATSVHRRWLRPVSRLARAGVRATLGVARRAWDTAHPDPPWTDQVHIDVGPPATDLPTLAIVVDIEHDGERRSGLDTALPTAPSSGGTSAPPRSSPSSDSGGTTNTAPRVVPQAILIERVRAAQTDPTTSWWWWSRSTNRAEPAVADDPSRTAVASPSDLTEDYLWEVTPAQLANWTSTTVELARMALAYDRPAVLRLDRHAHGSAEPDGDAIIVRRSLWHPEQGMDHSALRAQAALDETGVLGRDSSDALAHRITGHPFADEAGSILRRTGPWWVPARAEPRSYTHPVSPVSALPAAREPREGSDHRPTLLIVLATPLVAGCERLVADLLDAVDHDARVILAELVSGCSLAAARWRLLAARATHAYPVWAALPEPVHGTIVAALARRWRANDVLIISADGRIDSLRDAWTDGLERQRIRHMAWDGRASRSASVESLRPIEPILETGTALDASAGATLRATLGIAPTAVVVGLMTDLVATERPEDFVMVADRLRDDPSLAFLLGGDGPLAERIADLVNLLPPARLFWSRTGHDTNTFLAACDVVCSAAERRPTLALLRLAATAKRPIVASDVDTTASLLDDGPCGLLYPPGDLDALAAAVRVMKEPAVRAAYASAGPAAAARAHPGDPRAAWRAALRLSPEGEPRDR